MITQDLGIATAYGYAKSKGYTGTEAEFAELMASYASTAQTAIEAADRAVEANTAAQSAKTDAAASKTAAQTAAQTATTAASEASQSASTATTKASEASQSASTASAAATSASTSAQTATTAASTATTKASEAVVSANTATTAKTDAETARDAAAQSASDAAASAASIDPDEFNRKIYAAFATDTATGSIASFFDGADNIPMKDVLVHIELVQEGSGDPSPDNVRPITGWTGAKVMRCGKNILNPSAYTFQTITRNGLTYTVQDDGTIHVIGTATAIDGPTLTNSFSLPNGTYTYTNEASQGVHCVYCGQPVSGGSTFSLPNPFTVDGTFMVYINLYCKATGTYDLTIHPQLELGSTATDYEPYSGQTYDITFPTEAGTVYGGTLDLTTGVLTVDRRMVDLGSLSFTHDGTRFIANISGMANKVGRTVQMVCSAFTCLTNGEPYDQGFDFVAYGGYGKLYVHDSQYTDATAFTTAMNGQTLCYELATPITYHLTPQEITSLLGTNNLWADTGNSEVEYRADTKLYITKKITEAVSALS